MSAAKAVDLEPKRAELVLSGELDTRTAAQRLNVSTAWVRGHWQEIGGRRINARKFRFSEAAIQQYIITTTTKTKKTTTTLRMGDASRGPRAAAIYERLERGESVSTIVRDLEEPPEFVAEMRAEWRRGYDLDREGLVFRCACGAASNPHTAKCDVCAPRSLTLSDAQLAALSDMPPPVPQTCRCSGCGSLVGTHAARHICATCRVELGVLNGALVVTLGGATLRAYTVAETRALLEALVPRRADAPAASADDDAAVVAPVLAEFAAALTRDPAKP